MSLRFLSRFFPRFWPVAGHLALAGGGALLQPPVDAPIVDHFRPPACQWCAGNRGIDYDVAPGTSVRAAASGTVSFAGPVGNDLFVVVAHLGGYRTTYGFVSSVLVARGRNVRAGEVVALSGDGLHFGLRLGSRYLDPELYLGTGRVPAKPRLRPTFAATLGNAWANRHRTD